MLPHDISPSGHGDLVPPSPCRARSAVGANGNRDIRAVREIPVVQPEAASWANSLSARARPRAPVRRRRLPRPAPAPPPTRSTPATWEPPSAGPARPRRPPRAPRSSPAKIRRRRRWRRPPRPSARPLVHARRPHLEHELHRARAPARAARRRRQPGLESRERLRPGSSSRRCDGESRPLSSTKASPASSASSRSGSSSASAASQPAARAAELAQGGVPQLVAVLPAHQQLRPGGSASADSSRRPRSTTCRAGRPVISAAARTWVASSYSTAGTVGVDHGRGGSARSGRSVPSGSGRPRSRGRRRPRRRSGGGPAGSRHRRPANHADRLSGSGGSAGEDDGEPVQAHGVHSGREPDAEVEGELLASALSLG